MLPVLGGYMGIWDGNNPPKQENNGNYEIYARKVPFTGAIP